jgi:soluble lytic murein transglycosylase-like protein
MRKTIPKSEEERELGGDVMQGMFDLEISRHISQSANIGIGDLLCRQLTGEPMPSTPSGAAGKASGVRHGVRTATGTVTTGQLHIPAKVARYGDTIHEASKTYGLDPSLIKAVIAVESAGDERAVSSRNAKGLMQLIDSTAAEMGVTDVWDPHQNILGGSKYLKDLMNKFDGDVELALASYNAGPDTVARHGGIPPIPETRKYVNRVMNYLQLFQTAEGMTPDEGN